MRNLILFYFENAVYFFIYRIKLKAIWMQYQATKKCTHRNIIHCLKSAGRERGKYDYLNSNKEEKLNKLNLIK